MGLNVHVLAVPLSAATLSSLASCAPAADPVDTVDAAPERLTAVVQQRLDFDPTSFTQGLEVADDGSMYVATGMVGESRLYRRTVAGEELANAPLDPAFFGEGVTRAGDHLWQLTWKDGVAIKRDAETLAELERVTVDGEGWGVCSRQDEIIFSDGTSKLRRMDPDTLAERERFEVTLDGSPVTGLNELECVGGDVYANVFLTTDIYRIDAATGEVTAVIDASGLPNNATPDPNHVLNGIAHIPGTDEFYLSGKRWPDLYRVTFEPAG
ncbi:glutaminyl-peptide cyclotransferase [Corynebacterium sp.]|uniref:glutaminyl-peptide cyclotransferase n=1 Tax=Corynebacterium sp. TaxID=1720 RepID=UPI002A91BF66|nr:glutaminyl-peptide cyclotransferase [Corynebacterium sp.]MDY5785315.1 glutaminyl-peptide cyclotransferase [Corynebacterium sp.]